MPARRFRLLVHLFTRRFFENDLLAPDIDLRPSAIYLLAMLTTPAFLWTVKGIVRFGLMSHHGYDVVEAASWFDKALLVTLAMTNAGIVTLLCWEALLIDRRDALVLGSLPVRPWTLVAAKGLALLRMFAVVAALNLPPAFIFSVAVYSHFSGALVLRALLAHAVAATAASLATGLVLTAALVAVTSLFHGRALRLMILSVQVAVLGLLTGLLFGLQWVPLIGRAARAGDPAALGWLAAWPPLWFVGLYQALTGVDQGRELFRAVAPHAVLVVSAAVLCAPATLFLWRRALSTTLSAAPRGASGPGFSFVQRAAVGLVRAPFDRGLLQFFFAVLARSPRHRLAMLSAVGLAAAVTLEGVLVLATRSPADPRWLTEFAVPLLVVFVLLGTAQWLLTLPAELPASWILALSAPAPGVHVRRAAHRLLLTLVAIPATLLACGLSGWQGGLPSAAAHGAMVLLLALGFSELGLARVTYLPFATEYLPGRANLKARWPAYAFVLLWIMPAAAAIERALLAEPGMPFVIAATVLIVVVAWAHRRRGGWTDALSTDPGTGAGWRPLELRIGPV